MAREQINVRVDNKTIEVIDKKRIKLQKELKKLPTRSDVVRLALEEYLGIKVK